MNSLLKKKFIWIAAFALICGTATAQRRYHSHHIGRYPMTHIVVKPTTSVHVSQRITQQERLNIAIAYLKNNKQLTIKKYAKITGLSKEMAEAELDAFSYDKRKPITMVLSGKKKLYTLQG